MEITSIGRKLAVLVTGAAVLAGCGSKSGDSGTAQPATPAASSSAPSAPGGSGTPTAAPNGVAALAPSAILTRAKAALKSATSYHVKGTMLEDKQQTGLDFKIRGADVAGAMTIGAAKIELLRVGSKQFMKPNTAFWKMFNAKQADTVVQVVGNRWVSVPASNKDFSSIFSATDVNALLDTNSKLTKGKTEQIAGTPAIGLVDHSSDGGTLWVATAGKPYPLRLDGPSAADGGLSFSEFGATFADITVPPAADVLDLSKISG